METYSLSNLFKIALTDMTAPFAFAMLVVFGGFFVWLIVMRVSSKIERSDEREHEYKMMQERQMVAKQLEKKLSNKVQDCG